MATIASLSVLVEAKGQRKFLGDMAKLAAAVGAAGVAMDQLLDRGGKILPVMRAFGQRVGSVEGELGRLRSATMGLVSDYDLMQQANVALTLGSAETAEQFAELANVAQRLGRALGLDTAFALNSLNTGIARQSRLMLDNIGLIVSAEEANREYAAAVNKSVDELTAAEQKEAFRIAALTQAREKVAELGDDTRNASDAWNALQVEVKNAADALAAFVASSPDAATAIDGWTRDIRILRFEFESLAGRIGATRTQIERFHGQDLPSIETGAVGAGGPSVEERRSAQLAESERLREMRAGAAALVAQYEQLREQTALNVIAMNRFNQEGITLEQLQWDLTEPTALLGQTYLPDLGDAINASSNAYVVLRDAAYEANIQLSETQRLAQGAALGLGGLASIGRLFGFAVPGLGQLFGGLGLFRSISGLSDLFGGGKADGGPVRAGTAYMVGERGPEMFVPSQSGTIVPSGGITINVPPARDPITWVRDQQWTRAIQATFRELESNGFRAAT